MDGAITFIAVDPGNERSALVWFDTDTGRPYGSAIVRNEEVVELVRDERIVCEMIASYGMPVGREVFETCVWIGRFVQVSRCYAMLYRKDVKLHLCGSARAKDANVRQALLDLYGGKAAVGTKKKPGPLYGFRKDLWAALGVAVTYADQMAKGA